MERDNAVSWFEVAAADLARATRFYEMVLGRPLKAETIGTSTMSLFPYQQPGVGGCVIAGDGHVPSPTGTVIYLNAGRKSTTHSHWLPRPAARSSCRRQRYPAKWSFMPT